VSSVIENIQEIGVGTALVGLLIAFVLYKKINKTEISNPVVADITQQIQDGAMTFLRAEYRYLAIFIAIVAAALYANPSTEPETAVAFLAGAAASVAWTVSAFGISQTSITVVSAPSACR